MASASSALRPALTHDEVRALLGRTMWLVAGTAGTFALGDDLRTAPLLAAFIFLDILNVFFLLLSRFGGGDE